MKSIGIWIRVSTEFQVTDESPEHHEKRAEAYAELKGWDVKEVYRLNAVSGKSVMDHPETIRMLNDIKHKRISGIIFSKLARLARNTKQLLDFSEIFKQYDADLISLAENIDTSTSAGRLFYTMIAAMAQWEREEIADRVAASVPIRAKMGKPLGGQAPFGYKWDGKELLIDEKEAPIRKQMHELFVEHKRKTTVAAILNKKGYRTRNGSLFTDTTITRLLRDTTAKGVRRANYTKSTDNKKHWSLKPETDWVLSACPSIIDKELWDKCNALLDSQEKKRNPPARKPVHIFAGIMTCECGGKMYVPSRTTKYTCVNCKTTRIPSNDIEEIYYEQLKSFLLTKNDLANFLSKADETIHSKQIELDTAQKEYGRIKDEMDKLVKLHLKGEIPTEGFGNYFKPLDNQYKELFNSITETQAHIDFLKMQQVNSDFILENAGSLYEKWPSLEADSKRQIVEELTESITVGKEDIAINFSYSPSVLQNPPSFQRNVMDSSKPPT